MKQFPVRDKVNILPSDGTIKSWDSKELMRRYLMVGKAFDKFESEAREFTDELVKDNARMSRENFKLNEDIKALQRSLSFHVTDEDTKRMILKMYAWGNSISQIHKEMNETKRMDVTLETVRDVVTNLKNKELDSADLEYYNNEVSFAVKELPFKEEEYRIQMIREAIEYKNMLGELMVEIRQGELSDERNVQIGQFMAVLKSFNDTVKSTGTLMKGLNGNSEEGTSVNEAKELKEKLTNKANRVLENFNPKNDTMVVV